MPILRGNITETVDITENGTHNVARFTSANVNVQGGAVDSVNGKTGDVVLNASDVGAVEIENPDGKKAKFNNENGVIQAEQYAEEVSFDEYLGAAPDTTYDPAVGGMTFTITDQTKFADWMVSIMGFYDFPEGDSVLRIVLKNEPENDPDWPYSFYYYYYGDTLIGSDVNWESADQIESDYGVIWNPTLGSGDFPILSNDSTAFEVKMVKGGSYEITGKYVTIPVSDGVIAPKTFSISGEYPNVQNGGVLNDFPYLPSDPIEAGYDLYAVYQYVGQYKSLTQNWGANSSSQRVSVNFISGGFYGIFPGDRKPTFGTTNVSALTSSILSDKRKLSTIFRDYYNKLNATPRTDCDPTLWFIYSSFLATWQVNISQSSTGKTSLNLADYGIVLPTNYIPSNNDYFTVDFDTANPGYWYWDRVLTDFVDQTMVKKIPTMKQSETIVLKVANWANHKQTVPVYAVNYNKYDTIIEPVGNDYQKFGVFCWQVGDRELKFSCEIVPTTDITINVITFKTMG